MNNPWGSAGWNGDWSAYSGKWTARAVEILGPPDEEGHEFYISFSDFCEYFRKIYVCRVFEAEGVQTDWSKHTFYGRWSISDGTAQGCPAFLQSESPNRPEKNPQWSISVPRPCVVFLSLRQRVSEERNLAQIGFFVLENGGQRSRSFKKREIVGSSGPYSRTYEVTCEVQLKPDVSYVVFASTFAPGEEAEYTLNLYCRYSIAIKDLID
jgi:hypothetical protein